MNVDTGSACSINQSKIITSRRGIWGFVVDGSLSFCVDVVCGSFGLFRTYQRTRLSVAIESSTEECPTSAPPV